METLRLPARWFYGLVAAGLLLGVLTSTAGGWVYLHGNGPRPVGRRIWEGSADDFVLPVCAMIGATFGGVLGVVLAVAVSTLRARYSFGSHRPPDPRAHPSRHG